MLLRFIGYIVGMGMLGAIIVVGGIAWYVGQLDKSLPDEEVLNAYEPPVTSRIYAEDGSLISEYARERRLYLPIQAVPTWSRRRSCRPRTRISTSTAASTITALLRAVFTNLRNYGTDHRQLGASTITQQVAKNFLLTNERSIERKIKEAILAIRIEQAYSKDRILELYLNEIFFGLGAYGIAGAALTYFDKSVNELTAARGGLSRGAAESAEQLPSVQANRRGDRAPQLGHRSHGRKRLRHGGGGGRGQEASRLASTRAARPTICSRPNISPRKCAATSSSATARTRSTRAACRSARRSIRRCRSLRATRCRTA